jgi:hypothetical protein
MSEPVAFYVDRRIPGQAAFWHPNGELAYFTSWHPEKVTVEHLKDLIEELNKAHKEHARKAEG